MNKMIVFKKMVFGLLLGGSLLAFASPEVFAIDNASISQQLDTYMQTNQQLAKGQRFSGVILVAKGTNILFQKAYGLASKRFNIPNNLDTKFSLASIGKLFTITAIAQLVEKGKIKLSDPVVKYLPGWLPQADEKHITIEQLLIHASGLGSFFSDKRFSTGDDSGLFISVDSYKPLIRSEKLSFKPGTSQMYSNSGYILLGAIVQKVSGENYFDYVKQHIFNAANMNDSGFYRMDEPVQNLAIGYVSYYRDNKLYWKNNLFTNVLKGSPAGGAYSSVVDMYKFIQAVLSDKLLSKKYVQKLLGTKIVRPDVPDDTYHRGHNTVLGYKYYGDFTKYGFAGAWNQFGFAVWKDPLIVGHTGGINGVDDYFAFYPKSHYIVIILSNVSNNAKRQVLIKISKLLGYQFQNFNM